MLKKLQDVGLTPSDIHHLEYLDDKQVLHALPNGFRWLKKNNREDVVIYFETYAHLLEEALINSIQIPSELFSTNKIVEQEVETIA